MMNRACKPACPLPSGCQYTRGPSRSLLGVQNGASTWTSSSSYTQLSVPFTTGSSQTSITIYVHGWYAQGNVYADDFSLK